MKNFLAQWHCGRRDGSALLSAAVAAAVLGIMVISYLTWVTNEYRLAKRSHGWAQALSLCEAGTELALAEFNFYYVTRPATAFGASRGWANPTLTMATRTVTGLADSTGQTVGNVSITVSNIGSRYASIQCAGTVTTQGSTPVGRNLLVVLKKRPGFKYAMVSRQAMTLSSSSGLLIDSFNSGKITESTSGRYDVSKRTAHGNIASLDASASAITVKGVNVYGSAATAPSGHMIFQAGSSIGATFTSAQRTSAESTSEAAGWETHDFVYDMPDVTLPATLSSAVSLGDISGNYTFTTGDYKVGNLKNTSGNLIINGDVRIYVTGNVLLSGSSQMIVKTNATLEVYVTGSVTVGGNGMVNETGLAENANWLGLNSSTSWGMSGSFDFTGTVYAPRAALAMDGSADFSGAFVADSIAFGSSAQVHYDEALGLSSGKRGYTVLSWQPVVQRSGTWVIETN